MFKDFEFDDKDIVTDEMIELAYAEASDYNFSSAHNFPGIITEFSYEEQLNYLTQEIFENIYGFGVIDRLLETSVDEIDGGISGIPIGTFTLNKEFVKNAQFSSDAIWILFHGHNI